MTYHYTFPEQLPLSDVEDSLLLSAMAVESLYGIAAARLDMEFRLDRKERTCRVDSSTRVGDALNRIFAGFLVKQFGETAFKVRRRGKTRDSP